MNEGYPPQTPHSAPPAANQRQKSLEYMDQGIYFLKNELISVSAENPIFPLSYTIFKKFIY